MSDKEILKENEDLKARLAKFEAEAKLKAEAEKAEAEAEAEAEKIIAEKGIKGRYKGVYDEYVQLKFLAIGDAKLTDRSIKRMNDLETELLKAKGVKAKITQRCAVGQEILLLVKGIVIPEQDLEFIKSLEKEKQSFYI